MFLEPLARKLYLRGNDVYWPVLPCYYSVKHYIPYINWMYSTVKDTNTYDHILDFQHIKPADFTGKVLSSKYAYVGQDYNNWRRFIYNRDFEKEQKLMHHVGIQSTTVDYRLIHNTYATEPNTYTTPIPESGDIPNIYITNISGYSIFDWATIIQHAREIHVVSTCTLFLIELLDLYNLPDLHLYARHNDAALEEVRYILSKKWTTHNHGEYNG